MVRNIHPPSDRPVTTTNLCTPGVVDMDIYGAFQLCSIGILAAPLTVRLSRTYFYDPGRNIIFVWTALILAGLLALAVEFYRVTAIDCPNPARGGKHFKYGQEDCGLVCTEEDGPFSPLRAGPAANIGVIPIPTVLTFNTGMLLAAACCIPAVLSLMFTWDKILALHWKRRFGNQERNDESIEGTNGATVGQMDGINGVIRRLLSVIEIPLFSGAVLAILIMGEINFFSPQVRWETEPIASVGQWGPIAGTVLAALGSLYVLVMQGEEEDEPTSNREIHECTCQNGLQRLPTFTVHSIQSNDDYPSSQTSSDDNGADTHPRRSHDSGVTNSTHPRRSFTTDPGGRRRVAEKLQKAADRLGSAAHNKFDANAYNNSKAREFPEIPGEEQRNPDLDEYKRQFSRRRDVVLREESSRAVSPSTSTFTFPEMDNGPYSSPHGSPILTLGEGQFSESPERMPTRRSTLEVPSPTHTSFPDLERGRAPARRTTLEVPSPTQVVSSEANRGLRARRSTLEVPSSTQSSHTDTDGGRSPARRATLEVPSPTHHRA
ncbi:hypothetical protein N0V90_007650 [Kalmusia sp. IMI 367209]|nr:hypothetical protein N0V90_007650 [Kalmusia sp. IMI 367209]